jgi:transcriptional regulator with XRE-family HTH domain
VNVSPGAFTVGFFGAISNGLLLAGLRRWPDVVVEERTEPPLRPVPAAPGAQPHAVLLPAGAGDIHVTGGGAGEGEPVVPGTDRTRQPTGTERNPKLTDNRREIRGVPDLPAGQDLPGAGRPAYGGSRRVAGLRREEVALLAGVSVDYYTRLERGNAHSASDSVLEALASALQLDEAEHAHLFDLAHGANTSPATRAPRGPAGQRVSPSVQRILDSMTTTPAYVRNERMDILAANRLGRALYSPILTSPAQPANHARFLFLDPGAAQFYIDWERQAQDTVALLRTEAGRNPHDKALSSLIGELSTRSEIFRTWWAAHNVRFHRTGVKRLHHPVVGDLSLTFEALDLAADAGPADLRLHRRARLRLRGRPETPSQLGGDARPGRGSPGGRRSLTRRRSWPADRTPISRLCLH